MPVRHDFSAGHDIDVDVLPAYARRVNAELLRDAVRCALDSRRLRKPRAVSISVTDSRRMRALNRRYLGDDEATDVLSFNTDFAGLTRPDGVGELGTIVIALPVASRGARARGVGVEDELALLAVHGTLHLLGFDHESRREDAAMRKMERSALLRLGRPEAARGPTP